jgi:hypothetical protein
MSKEKFGSTYVITMKCNKTAAFEPVQAKLWFVYTATQFVK